jgi:hypothetical protein
MDSVYPPATTSSTRPAGLLSRQSGHGWCHREQLLDQLELLGSGSVCLRVQLSMVLTGSSLVTDFLVTLAGLPAAGDDAAPLISLFVLT